MTLLQLPLPDVEYIDKFHTNFVDDLTNLFRNCHKNIRNTPYDFWETKELTSTHEYLDVWM